MVTVFGEALAQLYHTDILNTCVCGKRFPLMGQCVARIQIEHSKTTADSPLPSHLSSPISLFVFCWAGGVGEREDRTFLFSLLLFLVTHNTFQL